MVATTSSSKSIWIFFISLKCGKINILPRAKCHILIASVYCLLIVWCAEACFTCACFTSWPATSMTKIFLLGFLLFQLLSGRKRSCIFRKYLDSFPACHVVNPSFLESCKENEAINHFYFHFFKNNVKYWDLNTTCTIQKHHIYDIQVITIWSWQTILKVPLIKKGKEPQNIFHCLWTLFYTVK